MDSFSITETSTTIPQQLNTLFNHIIRYRGTKWTATIQQFSTLLQHSSTLPLLFDRIFHILKWKQKKHGVKPLCSFLRQFFSSPPHFNSFHWELVFFLLHCTTPTNLYIVRLHALYILKAICDDTFWIVPQQCKLVEQFLLPLLFVDKNEQIRYSILQIVFHWLTTYDTNHKILLHLLQLDSFHEIPLFILQHCKQIRCETHMHALLNRCNDEQYSVRNKALQLIISNFKFQQLQYQCKISLLQSIIQHATICEMEERSIHGFKEHVKQWMQQISSPITFLLQLDLEQNCELLEKWMQMCQSIDLEWFNNWIGNYTQYLNTTDIISHEKCFLLFYSLGYQLSTNDVLDELSLMKLLSLLQCHKEDRFLYKYLLKCLLLLMNKEECRDEYGLSQLKRFIEEQSIYFQFQKPTDPVEYILHIHFHCYTNSDDFFEWFHSQIVQPLLHTNQSNFEYIHSVLQKQEQWEYKMREAQQEVKRFDKIIQKWHIEKNFSKIDYYEKKKQIALETIKEWQEEWKQLKKEKHVEQESKFITLLRHLHIISTFLKEFSLLLQTSTCFVRETLQEVYQWMQQHTTIAISLIEQLVWKIQCQLCTIHFHDLIFQQICKLLLCNIQEKSHLVEVLLCGFFDICCMHYHQIDVLSSTMHQILLSFLGKNMYEDVVLCGLLKLWKVNQSLLLMKQSFEYIVTWYKQRLQNCDTNDSYKTKLTMLYHKLKRCFIGANIDGKQLYLSYWKK